MMKNGDAFHAFIEETAVFLHDYTVLDYYREPLGGDTDERMGEVVARYGAATAVQRERFLAAMEKGGLSLFGIYGHRAATMAVRQQSRELLLRGLVAMGIANYVVPPKRNVETAVAIFHHCARKLGISPVELFDEAAQVAPPHMTTFFEEFGRRPDITLSRYGWQELRTPEGVRYKWG
ncbi:MAG: hypothetical protein KDE56_07215 [Anaerolineales bacterium]|nr:hypothetical protein [Anaerolineales bacterium]